MPYTYCRESDGTNETFDIRTPDAELMTSVPFWDDAEQAEAKARLIVDALNAHAATPQLFEALTLCHEQLSLWVAETETCDLSPEDEEALKKAVEAISMVAIWQITA